MQDLNKLSPEARYALSRIVSIANWWRGKPLANGLDEDPVAERLLGLAESLIILMDSSEFDVEHVVYELRFDPDTGDERDLAAFLRATEEEIEQAGAAAAELESDSAAVDAEHAPDHAATAIPS